MKPLLVGRSHLANWIHLCMDHSDKIAMDSDHRVEKSITFRKQVESHIFRLVVFFFTLNEHKTILMIVITKLIWITTLPKTKIKFYQNVAKLTICAKTNVSFSVSIFDRFSNPYALITQNSKTNDREIFENDMTQFVYPKKESKSARLITRTLM